MTTVAVSGGFDPLHVGHLEFFRAASRLGDRLVVFVESDEWVGKKHSVLMPAEERARIVAALDGVHVTAVNYRPDGNCGDLLESVCIANNRCRPRRETVYAVGPDHANLEDLPEYPTCKALGIRIICLTELEKKSSTEILAQRIKWVNPPVTVSAILQSPYHDQGLLLTRRAAEDRRGMLELPGGFLEVGETLEECLVREVREEIGAGVSAEEYLSSEVVRYHDGRQVLAVFYTGWVDGVPTITKENTEILWAKEMPAEPFAYACDRNAVADFLKGPK